MHTNPCEWSEERSAGQRLMAGFHGTRFSAELEHLVSGLRVGGLILFKRNVESPAQLAELCRAVQDCARGCGQPPLIVSIDQEGGPVARLGPPFTQFPGNPSITNARQAAEFAHVCARELCGVGINMNLAPVVDVAPEGFASIMGGRMFGPDPEHTGRMGAAVIEGLQSRGVMAVAKHFPGIGRTTLDSHLDLPVFDADPASLEAFDLIPFRRAIAARVAAIMLSHILYPALDPDWPASLSRPIVSGWLRHRMGYDGVVVTDDLEMGAVARHYGFGESVRQVLRAEVDLALICHTAALVEEARDRMARRISASEKIRRRHARSLERILRLKSRYLAADWPEMDVSGGSDP
jgi:beta-N-acetylhexosaminidase